MRYREDMGLPLLRTRVSVSFYLLALIFLASCDWNDSIVMKNLTQKEAERFSDQLDNARISSSVIYDQNEDKYAVALSQRNSARAKQQVTVYEKAREITPPARACRKSKGGIFFTGDYLLWKAMVDNLTYAIKPVGGSLAAGETAREWVFEKPAFDNWTWGFRAGAGIMIPYNAWDLYAVWAHYNQHISQQTERNYVGPLNDYYFKDVYADQASTHWGLHFNTYDADLRRQFMISRKIALTLNLGVRGAKIHQEQKTHYTAAVTDPPGGYAPDSAQLIYKFKGAGPRVGIDARWLFVRGFGILGKAAGSLLGGKMESRAKFSSSAALANQVTEGFNDARTLIRPAVECFLGLDLSPCLGKGIAIHLSGGYEMQYWWNQFQGFKDEYFYPSDLMIQGWTFEAGLDF